jgi:8-oxo-dGTP pyrophosphatase MutT (NUDIX family)
MTNNNIKNYFYNKFIDVGEYNYDNINNLNMIPSFYDKIKILMVRRNNSLNYVEFIRGKWDTNKESVKKKFELMTKEELHKIKTSLFTDLWNELWKETANHKMYMKEYNLAKTKFNELKNNNYYNLLNEDYNISQYLEPEWGFPKGRKNNLESNLSCATREFTEETNVDVNNIHIMERLNCMEEEFMGTNDKKYKHVYYIANSEEEFNLSLNNDYQMNEIGDIKWFSIPEAINKMRQYNDKKIHLLHQIYFFIVNLILNINKNNYEILI